MNAPNLHDGPFLAFHGDKELQAKMLASVSAHVKADQVIQGEYGEGEGKNFRGCFIGCTIHAHGNGDATTFNSNEGVFDAYGFPAPLTRICERIFEGLPAEDAPRFFEDVAKALKVGSDLSLVQWEFLHWMVKDTLAKYGTAEVKKGCSKSVAVLRDMARGVKVTPARADSARAAADAADYAAAGGAAHAAYAADAAADAADAADYAAAGGAAGAAGARYKEFAAKLLELLGGAK